MFWIEYVDRALQPNYVAQHGIQMQRLPNKGMSKEELLKSATTTAASLAALGMEIAMEFSN